MTRFFALALILLAPLAHAQLYDENSRLPISLDADFLNTDIDSSIVSFRGLRLNQGAMSIEADEGQASDLNFNESTWNLSGNIVIVVGNSRIECDNADLEFGDNMLKVASIGGAPATFELSRAGSEETTYAEAGILRYDVDAGSIEFSDNARIVEGGNQIASGSLVYNIRERRFQAQGSDTDDGKVKITWTPGDPEQDDDAATGESEPEDEAATGEPPP